MDEKIEEIHKMAQIALGKQVDKDCTKWAIEEGFFDNFEALYNAGYRKESDTAREIWNDCIDEIMRGCGDDKEFWVIKILIETFKKYGVGFGE